MKKNVLVIILICIVSVSGIFAQSVLNKDAYFAAFPLKAGENVFDNDFVWAADNDNYVRFARLSGNEDLIDSNLEFALLTYYSPSVIGKRPARANTLLPANDARTSGLRLGGAVYKELIEIIFFDPGNSTAIERHEEILQFIIEKNNVTRQQIETSYRNGIKALITEIVDEEFNKISFSLTNMSENKMYFMTMIRNPQNGRYTLHYEIPSVAATVKTINANARESMLTEMRRRADEFTPSDVDFVRAQAALIPTVAFQASVRTDVINVINAFYLNPNEETFNALGAKRLDLFKQKEPGQVAALSFTRVLGALNDAMADIGL